MEAADWLNEGKKGENHEFIILDKARILRLIQYLFFAIFVRFSEYSFSNLINESGHYPVC